MMKPFEHYSPGRIVFGRGQFSRIGELASQMGTAVLVVHNADETAERAEKLLRAANVRPVFLRQRGEPKVEDVDRGVATAREQGCDMVIGLGGGSAIDAAKAVAGLMTNPGVALDYMEVVGKGMKLVHPAASWIAVPTTAGTGAEATRNAVIGAPEKHFKASIRSEYLLPRVALVDAELGVKVRAEVTARSGMDALCQLIESYTSVNAQPMTDALAIKGIGLAARSLRRAYETGEDLAAREDMAMAALLSGITLANAGLGAVHGFAAPLGANFPVPHGTVCAVLLPGVIEANVAALRAISPQYPALNRYSEIGRVMTSRWEMSNEEAIEACIQFTRKLMTDLDMPGLGKFGLTQQDVQGMVALARKSSSMRYNPVSLPETTLMEILQKAIG